MTTSPDAPLPSLSEIDRLHAMTTPAPWQPMGHHAYKDGEVVLASNGSANDIEMVVALRNAWPAVSEALRAARALVEHPYAAEDVEMVAPNGFAALKAALGKLAP